MHVFLGKGNTLIVIMSADLSVEKVQALVLVLKRFNRDIGWTIANIIGIPHGICTHKIQLEEDCSPRIEDQRRCNLSMQEVVKRKIIKWLDTSVVYYIPDSSCISPVHCVPKKE